MLRIKSLSSNLITPRVSCHVCPGGVCVYSLLNADICNILSIHVYIYIACDVTFAFSYCSNQSHNIDLDLY